MLAGSSASHVFFNKLLEPGRLDVIIKLNKWSDSFILQDPSYQSKMTERSPWWKSFLPKKKSGVAKDQSNIFGPDYDPFAQHKQNAATSKASGNSQHESSNGSNHQNDSINFDESQLESMIDEKTFRRNMRESRSGRFKVRGKVRSTLPIEEKDRDYDASAREGIRRQWRWKTAFTVLRGI